MKKPLLMAAFVALGYSALANAQNDAQAEQTTPPAGLVELKPGGKLALPPVAPFVTYTSNYYQDKQLKTQYYSKWAAVEGKILKVEDGPGEKPILQIKLTNGVNRTLWIASIAEIKKEFLKVGNTIKVLGMFDKTAEEPEYIGKLNKDQDYLLSFCLFDTAIERPMYEPRLLRKCLDWEKGVRLPELRP